MEFARLFKLNSGHERERAVRSIYVPHHHAGDPRQHHGPSHVLALVEIHSRELVELKDEVPYLAWRSVRCTLSLV